MRKLLATTALVALLSCCAGDRLAKAVGPDPVTPGYLVCNTNDPGNTQCSWQGVDGTHGLPVTNATYTYNNVTTDTTTVVKSGAGLLHAVCLNTPVVTETITMFDNTSGSGTKIATFTVGASTQPGCVNYDVVFTTGLTVVTGVAAGDITVSFR